MSFKPPISTYIRLYEAWEIIGSISREIRQGKHTESSLVYLLAVLKQEGIFFPSRKLASMMTQDPNIISDGAAIFGITVGLVGNGAIPESKLLHGVNIDALKNRTNISRMSDIHLAVSFINGYGLWNKPLIDLSLIKSLEQIPIDILLDPRVNLSLMSEPDHFWRRLINQYLIEGKLHPQ